MAYTMATIIWQQKRLPLMSESLIKSTVTRLQGQYLTTLRLQASKKTSNETEQGLQFLDDSKLHASSRNKEDEKSFERRLERVRRLALEKKEPDEKKNFGAIDYDSPISTSDRAPGNNVLAKIGIGVAVMVLGLIFAFGDLFHSGNSNLEVQEKLGGAEQARLQDQLKKFKDTLEADPQDLAALEGTAVTYVELGEYSKAVDELRKLIKRKPEDVEALRLLAEVESKLGNYRESALTYKRALEVSRVESQTLVKGMIESLLAAGKPDEAVKEIIAIKDRIRSSVQTEKSEQGNKMDKDMDQIDSIQIELLLGRTYSQWGHMGDAVTVYNGLIASYPEDFRGYLAKGILLQDQGNKGEAERMFIQARFLAPSEFKGLIEGYSKKSIK